MGELIDDLLQFSRIGRADLHRSAVDVSRLVDVVVGDLRRSDEARTVDVVVEGGMVAQADPQLLRVVLENLLGNAWKFTSKTTGARIEVRTTTKDGASAFQVRDNGAGFDMTFAPKLFSPFQRLHTEAEFPGTGIGLATIRRIVERHGGHVWAEASVGQGAILTFTLPRREPS